MEVPFVSPGENMLGIQNMESGFSISRIFFFPYLLFKGKIYTHSEFQLEIRGPIASQIDAIGIVLADTNKICSKIGFLNYRHYQLIKVQIAES